jgi:hypothetical protein
MIDKEGMKARQTKIILFVYAGKPKLWKVSDSSQLRLLSVLLAVIRRGTEV